jgi:60 kDa SS-A/Ro ribonucleoprotein
MSYKDLMKTIFNRGNGAAPQSLALEGQVANAAGGHYFPVNDWARLDRFLVLGTEGGTYYVSPLALTLDNARAVLRCLDEDGALTVRRIVEISQSGRAPRNEPALFALALATAHCDAAVRRAALDALPKVARTGTHVLTFAGYVENVRGWGRGLRRGVAGWFTGMPAERLALQAVKYRQREGWSLRDLLRLAHPLTDDRAQRALFDWIAHPEDAKAIAGAREAAPLVDGLYRLRDAASVQEAADAIVRYSLPREAVPTGLLNERAVWDALLVAMPLGAMIRNLGKMSAVGLITPGSAATRYVAERLTDVEQLKRARVHPVQLLLALRAYAKGRGALGGLAWAPAPKVSDALDEGFDRSFGFLVPTGRRILVAVDVSGSMHWSACAGSRVMNCLEAGAAMAMTYLRTEEAAHIIAFDTAARPAGVSERQRLDDVVRTLSQWSGGTDVAQPMLYALKRRLAVDAFVVVTDNETWAGLEHPVQALARYRQQVNPEARAAVMACAANGGSVVPDGDALALGIAGFDAAAQQIVGDFLRA